jgi:serine protease Do
MSPRFTALTVALSVTIAFFVGLTVSERVVDAPATTAARAAVRLPALPPVAIVPPGGAVNFADVAALVNPSVVNVEAASRRRATAPDPRNHGQRDRWDDEPQEDEGRRPGEPEMPDSGSGSGVIVEAEGFILTNHHVIDGAERITVKLADGRSLRARVVGSDPATDVALIKVDSPAPLPAARLGDSGLLRVGEWVCAIGNPLAYEHTVTVGVVSYLGRKLYDASLDDYIQTDAAINYGNSGGPLINARGEVIGINAAMSWKASNIGFAIPINQAVAILPQLKASGRVSRGYLGVTLRELDPDLVESLGLGSVAGALVQDVTEGSPGARAGLRAYDVILSVDGEDVRSNDDLVRRIAARAPGMTVRLRLVRDGLEQHLAVRLTERPAVEGQDASGPGPGQPRPARGPVGGLGVGVREIDRATHRRLELPDGIAGVLVTAVDPLSSAYDAGMERGDVILEVNRHPVRTLADYQRLVGGLTPGRVVALYCFVPELGQRALRAVRVEALPE